MASENLDERLNKLVTGFNGFSQQLQTGQIRTDPFIKNMLYPMFGDLMGCVQILHELTDDRSDELAEPVMVLVNAVEQVIKADVLPPEWQGLLLFSLSPTLEALEITNGSDDFKARFQEQIEKLEAWKASQPKQA